MGPSLSVACGQLLYVGLAGTVLTDAERTELARGLRGGVVLFRRNVTGGLPAVAALARSVADAAAAGGLFPAPPLVAVDQEGGRVMRLGPPALQLPSMRRLGALGDTDFIARVAEAQARELRALGFTMTFSPVADVHTRDENPIIGDRAFSTDPSEVARLAGAFADGLARGGMLTCAKHFPGHGDTTVDSHLALPRVSRDATGLESLEIAPFRALARNPSVHAMMTAHVVYDALVPELPATLAPAIATTLLRNDLGFPGVLFSDDLEMKAITGPAGEAAVASVAAGCDALLVCSRADLAEEVHAALVQEAQRSEAFRARVEVALARVVAMRSKVAPTPATDPAALARAFTASDAIRAELARRLEVMA